MWGDIVVQQVFPDCRYVPHLRRSRQSCAMVARWRIFGDTMCRSMVDIHSATAEIRRWKKKKKKDRRNHTAKIIMSASATQGSHNEHISAPLYVASGKLINARWSYRTRSHGLTPYARRLTIRSLSVVCIWQAVHGTRIKRWIGCDVNSTALGTMRFGKPHSANDSPRVIGRKRAWWGDGPGTVGSWVQRTMNEDVVLTRRMPRYTVTARWPSFWWQTLCLCCEFSVV